jgi:adenylate cyclase
VDDIVPSNHATFGRLRYDRHLHGLFRLDSEGRWIPVAVGSRALQVLAVLLRHPGALVSKDELMDAVWPDVTVEANNLTVQIAALRRVLDEGGTSESRIRTVSGRGYRFAGPVDEGIAPPAPTVAPAEADPAAEIADNPVLIPASAPPPIRLPRIGAFRGALAGRSVPVLAALAVLLVCLMSVAAVWMLARTQVARTSPPGAVLAGRQQIAVLPLLTIGGGEDYFADGLTEDLIAALGRFPEVAVRARGAIIAYKDHPATPGTIGQALAVRYVVEGSVQRAPDHLRVSVRLVGTDSGTVLWSETYDAEPSGVFALQADITRRIAGALSVRLDTLAIASAVAKPPDQLEAYDLMLRGRQRLGLVTRAGTSEARTLFEQAIALVPDYAAAYAGLGLVNNQALDEGWTGDPDGTLARSIAYGQKAVALQEDNPVAHAVLGRALIRAGNYDVALEELKRAMALNPSDPVTLAAYGEVLSIIGDSKGGLPFMEESARFRPDRPAGECLAQGAAYILAGRPADAVRVLEQGQTGAGRLVWFSVLLAISYGQLDRTADAAREVANLHRLNPGFDARTLGSLLRRPEDRELIRAGLERVHL